MINLFSNITSKDQSIVYLSQIFGNMSGVIPAGKEITIIGTMFRAFNSVVLAIGALIIIYVTVVGVMQTAHEGEFMGKKWNNLWIPLRTVLGIAALIPTVSGFSAIQIVMMWVILQGVGAANFLWETALGAIDVLGSPYAQSALDISTPSGNLKPTLKNLFQALTCDATAQVPAQDPTNTKGGSYYCGSKQQYCSGNYTLDPNSTTISFGPGKSCGTLTYCNQKTECTDPSSTNCFACKAQIQVLSQLVRTFAGIGAQFANADLAYRNFYVYSKDTSYQKPSWITDYCTSVRKPPLTAEECCVPPDDATLGGDCKGIKDGMPALNWGEDPTKPADPQSPSKNAVDMYKATVFSSFFPTSTATSTDDFMDVAAKQYSKSMADAVSQALAAKGASETLSGNLQKAKNDGWLLAGSYYYTIAQMNNNTQQAALPTFSMPPANIAGSEMAGFRNNFSAAGYLVGIAGGTEELTSGAGAVQQQGLNDVAQAFKLSGSTDDAINPLAQLQIAGYTMLMAAQVMYAAFFLVTLGLGIGGNISIWVLGTGVSNPVGPAALLMYLVVIPVFYAFLGILVTLGGLLAIYVPLIPFIIFAFGAIGWFIAVIETMVAGPIVALGILGPSQQDLFLGNAQPALMLLFNVFMRPSLMIFGLLTGMVLASVAVRMVNYAFWGPAFFGIFSFGKEAANSDAASAAKAAAVFNPVAFCLFLMAYVTTIVSVVNKCFALIHILPQQVLAWIGAQGMPGGAETGAEAVGEAKSAVTKAAGSAAGGMVSGGQKIGGVGAKAYEDKQARIQAQRIAKAVMKKKK